MKNIKDNTLQIYSQTYFSPKSCCLPTLHLVFGSFAGVRYQVMLKHGLSVRTTDCRTGPPHTKQDQFCEVGAATPEISNNCNTRQGNTSSLHIYSLVKSQGFLNDTKQKPSRQREISSKANNIIRHSNERSHSSMAAICIMTTSTKPWDFLIQTQHVYITCNY